MTLAAVATVSCSFSIYSAKPSVQESSLPMNDGLLTDPASSSSARKRRRKDYSPGNVVFPLFNLLATIHIVGFYVNRVPSYLDLKRYEAGLERMPFQGRLLMEYPLRWAHSSSALISLAAWVNSMRVWVPRTVLPEDFVEGAIYLASIVIAGMVACDLYRLHSRRRQLSTYVYPLVLVMVAGSYCMGGMNFFRYVYDLPSLGLFSIGLYLIARRRHPALFAALFVVATINRESSLFLLLLLVASSVMVQGKIEWRRALNWKSGGTAVVLAIFWVGWRIWTERHFAGLHVESGPGVFLNFACLLVPLFWPQLAGIAAYTLPAILIFRKEIHSAELRLWLCVFPLWFACMMYFGVILEIRLFGELIPLFACTAMLLAEERRPQPNPGLEANS